MEALVLCDMPPIGPLVNVLLDSCVILLSASWHGTGSVDLPSKFGSLPYMFCCLCFVVVQYVLDLHISSHAPVNHL
jgi:hypothetical protein